MASVNRVFLLGNLGKDPELRETKGGMPVCNLNIATSRRWVDKDGKTNDETEWHRVIVWGKTAANCAKYLAKGKSCYVDGRMQTREYKNKDGVTISATEIVADSVLFLSPANGKKEERAPEIEEQFNMEEIPF